MKTREFEDEATEIGIKAILMKPFLTSELAGTIRRVLEEKNMKQE